MSETLRQSALLLHSLHELDRQWILSQLAEHQRAQLSIQLTELKELGIPVDRSLAENLLTQVDKRAQLTQSSDRAHKSDRPGDLLRTASADAVLALLGGQPSWLIAMVLSIEAWPWREAIYVGVDASKRERIKLALGDRPPAKMAEALVREMETRLPKSRTDRSADPAPPKGWSFFRQQFKHLPSA